MALPEQVDYLIVGAGIHGLSTAWRLAQRLSDKGESVEGRVVVLDKDGIAAGASGIACGVVRNNYFQPAMRELMAHSVGVWESDPEAFSYHSVGYMQISCEAMHEDVAQIHREQQAIDYPSDFIEGGKECTAYMKQYFSDWQAQGITSILHEKKGGFANNTTAIYALAKKAEALGVRIITGVEVTGINKESSSDTVSSVETSRGTVACGHLVLAPGPWARDFWTMLELPETVSIKGADGSMHDGVDMWRFWQLEEGVLQVKPEMLLTDSGDTPPVLHVDTDAPLLSTEDGSTIIDGDMWGIYYKPDWHFNGVQGGAAPYKVETPVNDVQIDPYGPSSPEFVASPEFAHMWVSALAHCHKRFEGHLDKFHREPSGGIGCFTPDSFPVFDHFENASMIADSNHGYKMLGVGHLIADEILGEEQALLKPFRLDRYAKGELHPTSNSPFPWS